MDIRSPSSGTNRTFTVEDMMDYASEDTEDYLGPWHEHRRDDEPMLFDANNFYEGLFDGRHHNFSGFTLEDLGSDFVLGNEVSGLMLAYMKHRPYVLGSILVLTTILGVCANVTLIVILLKKGWDCMSFTSVVLLNLAVACLLFLVGGMPLLLVENVFGYGWQLGVTVCQVHRYVIYVSFFSISYGVVALLLHQTLSLYLPDRMSQLDAPAYAIGGCGSLWVVILTANVPNYLGHGITEEVAGISYCYNKEVHADAGAMAAWTIVHFVFSFALPFLMLCACVAATILRMCGGGCCCCSTSAHLPINQCEYNRLRETPGERRGYVTLALVITLTFAVCWAPDKIYSLMLVLHPQHMDAPALIASDVMMVMAYLNPSLNPIIILLSSLREVKSIGARNSQNASSNLGGLGSTAAAKRTIAEDCESGKQGDSSTSLPLCTQEDIVDPEMITTV